MLKSIESLEEAWGKRGDEIYDNAFVNPYDVGGYVSDYLVVVLSTMEGSDDVCSCTNDSAREAGTKLGVSLRDDGEEEKVGGGRLNELKTIGLGDPFERFKWISQFLEFDEIDKDFVLRCNELFVIYSSDDPPVLTPTGKIKNYPVVECLVDQLPPAEDDDANEGLWDIVRSRQGDESVRMKLEVGTDKQWVGRATIVRWLCWKDFLTEK